MTYSLLNEFNKVCEEYLINVCLVEEQEIVREDLFSMPKPQDRLDIYSLEGKSESFKRQLNDIYCVYKK